MRVVILQPFYLPYCGVFELVRLADAFVFYDDVQLERQNWQTRNRISTPRGPQWLTVPVIGPHDQRIVDTLINERTPWRRKHWAAIEQNYGSAPGFGLVDDVLHDTLRERDQSLADLNIRTFRALCDTLGVQADWYRSSELGIGGASSQRVLDHCIALGATRYLSGPAGRSYLDEARFVAAGITLEYFAFQHPRYPQIHNEFTPNLSVVDLLANAGASAGDVLAGSGYPVDASTMDTPKA
jgi:hypothetical protein